MVRLFWGFLCSIVLLSATAQSPDQRERNRGPRNKEMEEKILVERIAFFTDKIGLTSSEAQLFWPIYNEMDNKRTKLFDEKASILKQFIEQQDQIKGKELDKLLDRFTDIQKQESGIPSEYDARFRKILSSEKVMKMYVAEMQFRNYLLHKMRGKRDTGSNSRQ